MNISMTYKLTFSINENSPILNHCVSDHQMSSPLLWKIIHSDPKSAPTIRRKHSAVLYNHSIFIFGGVTTKYSHRWGRRTNYPSMIATNNFWAFDLRMNKWYSVSASGEIPSARFGHSAIVWKKNMVLFGGYSTMELDDCYIFSFDTYKWSLLSDTRGKKPSPRSYHSGVSYRNQMLIYGGVGGDSTVYSLDLIKHKWTSLSSDGPSKNKHCAVVFNDDMYVFGDSDLRYHTHQGLYSFHIPSKQWTRIISENEPSSRCFMCASVYRNKMLVFGGFMGSGSRENSLYEYDFSLKTWKYLKVSGDVPCPRSNAVCVTFKDSFIVYGGESHLDGLREVYEIRLWNECIPNLWKNLKVFDDVRIEYQS